jgi:hypothetical protein
LALVLRFVSILTVIIVPATGEDTRKFAFNSGFEFAWLTEPAIVRQEFNEINDKWGRGGRAGNNNSHNATL